MKRNSKAMMDNHKALFQLLGSSKESTITYQQEGLFSVMAINQVYPKLTLCYNVQNKTEIDLTRYLVAVEKKQASPYMLLPESLMTGFFVSWLKGNGFRKIDVWTYMTIQLSALPEVTDSELQIVSVDDDDRLEQWLSVVESNFFYHAKIERDIFSRHFSNNDLTLWLGKFEDKPVCAALSYIQADSVGLYMISTNKEFRGKGFGKQITLTALHRASSKNVKRGLLQATRTGTNLYESIGFRENEKFLIYWKVGKQYL